MANLITIIILLVIVGTAVWYIWKEKKKGNRCIGCSNGCSCSGTDGCGGHSCGKHA